MQWEWHVVEEERRKQTRGQAVWSRSKDVGAASQEAGSQCVCERTITSGDLLWFKDSEGGEAQPEKSPPATSTEDDRLILIQQGAKNHPEVSEVQSHSVSIWSEQVIHT